MTYRATVARTFRASNYPVSKEPFNMYSFIRVIQLFFASTHITSPSMLFLDKGSSQIPPISSPNMAFDKLFAFWFYILSIFSNHVALKRETKLFYRMEYFFILSSFGSNDPVTWPKTILESPWIMSCFMFTTRAIWSPAKSALYSDLLLHTWGRIWIPSH